MAAAVVPRMSKVAARQREPPRREGTDGVPPSEMATCQKHLRCSSRRLVLSSDGETPSVPPLRDRMTGVWPLPPRSAAQKGKLRVLFPF